MIRRLRVVLHALDRTGPPMLALAFLRWLAAEEPGLALDVVSFRGGDLEGDASALGTVTVLLRDHEPWDCRDPDPLRSQELSQMGEALPEVDVVLVVSVAGGQCLPYLPEGAPIVVWSVEQGEDLHWVDEPVGLRRRADRWLAGASGVRDELRGRLGPGVEVALVPEFVSPPPPHDALADAAAAVRARIGAGPDDLLVVGAGIATYRKAPDLFCEVALAAGRAGLAPTSRFAWIGGTADELHPLVAAESDRLGLTDRLVLVEPVADIHPWFVAADVLVHPARLDAFPLVCLHAAAVGTPVVAFRGVGGLEEMFGPAFVGCPYPDVRGLAGLVLELQDPDRRAAVGAAQRAEAERRWLAPIGGPVLAAQLEAAIAGFAR